METIKELLQLKGVTIELLVKLPYGIGIEHCITTVDGNKRFGFISNPVLFARISYNGEFAFTLCQDEFPDHINVDISDALVRLEQKTIAFLNNGFKLCEGTSWHSYALGQRDSHLSHLPKIFKGV